MRNNFVILILAIILGLILSTNIVKAVRPFSVPCEFEAEIVGFSEIIEAGFYQQTSIEEIELTLKMISYEPPVPRSYWYDTDEEALKKMCTFPSSPVVKGNWYPPGQPFNKDQPYVDKNKVLVKGSIIKGGIDSFDKTIEDVSLVKEVAEKDITDTTNSIWYISAFALILGIVVIFFIKKYRRK